MGSRDFGLRFLSVAQLMQGGKPVLNGFRGPDIHVWGCLLEGGEGTEEQCDSWLSAEERTRAARFVRPEDRRQYVLARGALRILLSRYTGLDPVAIRFQEGAEGKPRLGDQCMGTQQVRFNLSHSHGRMLVGIANQRDVGVDLELIRNQTDILKLAERFYAPAEFDAIASLDASVQRDAFYRHWVAKEAYLKFKGVGLTFPLGQCRVTLAPDSGSAAISWQKGAAEAERGLVKFLPLPDGWVGAVAAEGADWTVRLGEGPFE